MIKNKQTDREILIQMLAESVLIPIEHHHQKPVARLRDQQSKTDITINRIPADTLVIKADKFPAPDLFFKGDAGESKRADYIIFNETDKIMLFIELKSGDEEPSHIKKQLKGAACVLAYCKEAGRQFHNKENFINDGYERRYIGIVKYDDEKRTSSHESQLNMLGDSFEKIISPKRLDYTKLKSASSYI